MMDDFGDTSISQALTALSSSYGAPGTGSSSSDAGPPSYYGPPSPTFQAPSVSYGVPGSANIPSYLPLSRDSLERLGT